MNQPPRAVLLDVEGTTTPVDFVVGTLFGLARERLGSYLGSHGEDAEVRAHLAGLRVAWEAEDPASGRPPWSGRADDRAAATAYASWLTHHDRKVTALKALQGLVWADEYRSGRLVAPVYDDVAPALERWARRGTPASIFSSGSVLAQRMLFEHTSSGDLTGLLSEYFDTAIGPKREAASYAAIAARLDVAPADVLFVSDTAAELDAARDAGMRTALCVRVEAAETTRAGSHRVIESFAELEWRTGRRQVMRASQSMAPSDADLSAQRLVALPRGLFGPNRVDVAYEPWRAVRSTTLRVGPSSRAPAVKSDSGESVGLGVGQHLGRQTTRNPQCLDSPPLRAVVDGFVWGYCMPPATRKSGWMLLSALEADPAFEHLACGPADADFDRRRPDACGGHCDGRPLAELRAASGSARVTARDVYLRWAPGSTAFRYLVRGDEIRQLIQTANGRWIGVEVRTARWASRRVRGWLLGSALTGTRA